VEESVVDLGCISTVHWLELLGESVLETVEVPRKQSCAASGILTGLIVVIVVNYLVIVVVVVVGASGFASDAIC
jgi:hypothetical protein